MRKFFGLKQLQSKVFRVLVVAREAYRVTGHLQVNTGDSINWTNLSIWMSMFTVISSSALMLSGQPKTEGGERQVKDSQYLQEVISLLISLRQKAK